MEVEYSTITMTRNGEANLPQKCVINTTQIKSVDKKSKVLTMIREGKKLDEVMKV